MTDRVERYGHHRDLKLAVFEREIMKEQDLYKVQELCVKLFARCIVSLILHQLVKNRLTGVSGC